MAVRPKDRSLESFRVFPYVSWFLVIGFAAFAYHLTSTLNHTTTNLGTRVDYLEEQLQKPVTEVRLKE